MSHTPIQLKDITLSFPHKTCFEDFRVEIFYGSRIAIVGRNGSGKSSLLNMLLQMPIDARIGYVPQIINEFEALSGAERFNKALTAALSIDPNILLLDEPTNHLDLRNRKSLMRMLKDYVGTLIIVSHDIELLRTCVDSFWYINQNRIQKFNGDYDNLMHEISIKRSKIENEYEKLNEQKKAMHETLMREQRRAAKSRAKGEKSIDNRKWPTIVSKIKASRASQTAGAKNAEITQKKNVLNEMLSVLPCREIIKPKFSLNGIEIGHRTILSVNNASVGYPNHLILQNLSFSIQSHDRIAIMGDNGCGKSTLIKAILNDSKVIKSGDWFTPKAQDIGYLDQQYGTLRDTMTVLETIQTLAPTWHHTKIRFHLSDFLFRKDEEVQALVSTLSGGEKARLCLAQIAVNAPMLLVLDEVTNNLDIETREHIVQILQAYPGAIIAISHDMDFLNEIKIDDFYRIRGLQLIREN